LSGRGDFHGKKIKEGKGEKKQGCKIKKGKSV